MKEVALAVGLKNKDIIECLQSRIKSKLDFCRTIITTYCDNNFCYLMFAFNKEFSLLCEEAIKEEIIDYIENVYKVNFLKEHIKNPTNNTLAFNAYIKVLAIFDKSTDKKALRDIILFNQTFFIDSFLEFRLSPLKVHWLNLAHLSSDNMELFNVGTFVEVIRFLINTMEHGVYKIKVVCDNENFKIYNIKEKNDKVQKIAECGNCLELVDKVLDSCPNYVDIYLPANLENEAVNFLSNVYKNRLKIFSKD